MRGTNMITREALARRMVTMIRSGMEAEKQRCLNKAAEWDGASRLLGEFASDLLPNAEKAAAENPSLKKQPTGC